MQFIMSIVIVTLNIIINTLKLNSFVWQKLTGSTTGKRLWHFSLVIMYVKIKLLKLNQYTLLLYNKKS